MKIQIPPFQNIRVLVVGDVMLDRYWHGSTSRISPEAPVPIVHVHNIEEQPGGAGNVALNIRSLGSQVTLLGFCGEDEAANTLEKKLLAADIDCRLQRIPGMPTITKQRVLSLHQQLIRLDFENRTYPFNSQQLIQQFEEILPQTDCIILSDYAKGTLNCAPDLIARARRANKPIFVDPKNNDFNHYRGAHLITPNRKEFEAVVGPCQNEHEIVSKGMDLIHRFDFDALLITRGEQGMTLLRQEEPELHLPAREQEVYDVTGAGDTVISVLAASVAAGAPLATATALANIAASIVVSKLGAAHVKVAELRRILLKEHHSTTRGILGEDQLQVAIEDARAHGERIVMTSGCFDILHAGHVAYLEEAKRLGDRLIVAINDDGSVTRLKGPTRPINSIENRMRVLAALEAVDWVVPFSEQTPERIVAKLKPDLWVKGGNYRIEDLPEARHVLENKGEVKILNFVEGCSTTSIVERIKG